MLTLRRRIFLVITSLLLINLVALTFGSASAQDLKETVTSLSGPQLRPLSLTLSDAVEMARRNFPEIKAAVYRAEASKARVRKEKTAYLPRGSMLVQEMRGTSNQITGPLLPNGTIPVITGAEVGGNDLTGGWGSATGTLLSWEPFDFGLRAANVRTAQAEERFAKSQVALTELDAVVSAAETFLKAAAAQQAVKASKAKLDRMTVLKDTVRVLVDKHLRSNTDGFLAEAEEAKARDQFIEAEQSFDLAIASLAEAIGLTTSALNICSGLQSK